jgi:hypothetical protein
MAEKERERLGMAWYPCPVCIYNHPFEVSQDRPCPNLALSAQKTMQVFGRDNVFLKPLGPHERPKKEANEELQEKS